MRNCAHWLFEDQAEKQPSKPALIYEKEQITYEALNKRCNRIAHALASSDFQPGDTVAVLQKDGPDAVAALIGVMKAGGIVVYLDPSYPTQRLRTIVSEAKPKILVGRADCLTEHAGLTGKGVTQFKRAILLDKLLTGIAVTVNGPEVLERASEENPERGVQPWDPAYIVYTSGSTGTPKGIIQSHQSFCQFIDWQARQFGIKAPERFAQWASFAYDACYREVFSTLAFGATLCMAPASVRYSPRALIDWLRTDKVSILNVVPSFWRQVVEILKAEHKDPSVHPLPDLKVLLHPGEPLPVDLAHTWLTAFPNPARLFNLYGPSECILATVYEVSEIAPGQRSVPIGQAIDGREILILDENNKPCEPGVEGEIYVRSQFLTLGYHGDPEKTAEKFMQNPLHADFDDPVLRTGDLGRWREDGLIEFVGRRDRMVKIRGQRVELGDIEYVLRQHEKIRNCAVIVREKQKKAESMVALERDARDTVSAPEQVLVAYFTADGPIPGPELRAHLEASLPVHMVPQRFVQLDEMPLNANRKLDLNALPDPDDARPDVKNAYVAPRTELEQKIAEVWQTVLGVEQIGVDDGFLELGGNSLLAMQVLNRMRKTINLKMSFRELFKAQTIANLAAVAEERAAAKAAKEAEAAANKQTEAQDGEPAAPAAVPEPAVSRAPEDPDKTYPLSKAQEGVWFLWQLDPDNPYYSGQGSIRIKGSLDLEALNKAWRELLARHELTRVRYAREGGQPRQRFVPVPEVNFVPEDLSDLPEDERYGAVEAHMRERAKRAFNLENDALLEYRLYRLCGDEHIIAISFHEVILDLWSLTVLIRDLGAFYRHFAHGEAAPAPLTFGFREYAQWEHDAVTREKMSAQREYWKDRLSGELPVLSLPTDRPYPTQPSYRGGAKSVFLDADLSARLKELARNYDATLFQTLLTGVNMLLRMYSGQDDIIVGSPLANRQHPQSEDLVGFFLNMLPLRTRFSDDPTFAEVLKGMNDTVTGALSHADYPFAWMLEGAQVRRDLSVQPAFQVMFNMLNLPQISQQSGGITLTYDEFDTGYIKYDLAFYAQEQGDRIYFQIAYLTDLFDGDTIQRMLDNFVIMLSSMAASPETQVSKLRKLANAERQTLLYDFNQTIRPFEMDATIERLFEEQAAATPNAPAYYFDGQALSYADLNERANQLAHYLRKKGVKSQSRVAICIDRSFEMVIGLMGILKSGGAYVAIDTTYPEARQKEILDESDAQYLLITEALDCFDDYAGTKIRIDADRADIDTMSPNNPEPMRTPDMTMNIVYTSSTTGRPKGVLIPERAVLNRLHWMWQEYPFQDGDVALLQKSYAIVASSWELFGALVKGHPTVILSYDELVDPVRLMQRAVDHKVTHFLATPALIESVLHLGRTRTAEWTSLRFATTSAEQIPVAMVEQWREAFPGVPLLNLYGATECSSNATAYDTRDLNTNAIRVPVGKPLANVQVYVLDQHGDPVPLGATGEMCVAGACVADGYINFEELNRTQFIKNPFSDEHGPVIYRTGDLARFRADGNLELVGRRDNQVTVRGFRVELNDVEAAMMRHDNVEKAAVIAVGTGSRRRLAAFAVLENNLTPNDLRQYMTDRLPRYMVPADIQAVDQIPLTKQGKVDRRTLATMAERTGGSAEAYVAPRNEIESKLADIWAGLLEVERVGIHDEFFELGGHSLLAVELFAKLRDEFECDLPLATLYQSPTVAELSSHLQPGGGDADWSTLVPIRPHGDKAPLFCIHGIYGEVLFYREFAENLAQGHPVYALQPMSLSGRPLGMESVEDLAASYIEQMKSVQPKGPYFLCGYSFGGTAVLEIAHQLRAAGEEVAMLAIFDTIIGASWADRTQHTENLGQTRQAGQDVGLRGKLRSIYALWRPYMMVKGMFFQIRGKQHEKFMQAGQVLPREFRNDYTAWALRRLVARYTPKPYEGRILLFCSQKRKKLVVGVWEKIASGGLDIIDVSGDHLFIFERESAKFLADEVSKRFETREQRLAAE